MNNIRSILLVISMLFLAGCAASWNSIGNTANSPASSEQEYQEETVQECAATTEEHSKTQQTGDNVFVKTKSSDKYSVSLSFTVFDNSGDTMIISPAELEIILKSTGDIITPDSDLLLGVAQPNDELVIDGSPQLDILEFSDWNIAAVRVPSQNNGEKLHETSFYYFNDSIVQLLGNNLFKPMLPAGSIIEADTENNCFSFVDSEGNSERYTVVYDDYYEAYYLRLADYSAETFKEEYSTHNGELNFSYTVYKYSENKQKISAHNFVEYTDSQGKKHSCEVLSPVYQPAMSFDGLAEIEEPIEFEVLDFAEWGIAAVRVPKTNSLSGLKSHVVSLFYFDNTTLQMLGDGYFYPEIPADSRIGVDTDNNCFSITDIEGNTKKYTTLCDPDDERHFILHCIDG